MSSVFEDLWYGNISPSETYLDNNEKYRALLTQMGNEREQLTEDFTEKQTKQLARYDSVLNLMQDVERIEAFKCGFRLAVDLLHDKSQDD